MDAGAVIFDFDGTVADTLGSIVRGMRDTFAEQGLEPPSAREVADAIGVPLPRIVASLLPPGLAEDSGLIDRVATRYRQLSKAYLDREIALFPGMGELLTALGRGGTALGLLTNRYRADLEPYVERLGLDRLFDLVVAGDDYPIELRKPNPTPLLDMASRFGVEPRRVIMVGDTVVDVEVAKRAGATSVAVTFGCHTEDRLAAADPDHLASSVRELRATLLPHRA